MAQSEKTPWDCCDSNFIVIEIIFFLFKVGDAMLDPAARLFIYQGVCLQHFPNGSTCANLEFYPKEEDFVQKRSASYIMYFKLLLNLPAVFLGLFCGAWSDRVGRKLPVLMSPLGTILGVMCLMMSMMVPSEGGFLGLVLLGATIRGAFGKSAVITMALHSYVSDTSDREQRTRRLGKLLAMNFYGYFTGSLLVGALLEICSFDVIFCTVVFAQCICVLVTVLFMKDSAPPNPKGDLHEGKAFGVDDNGSGGGKSKKLPFHWHHVVDSINVLVRPRENKGRCLLLLFFFTIIAQQVCKSGETDTTLLFVEKSPLQWNRSLYGFLLATDYACLGLAVFLLLPILIRLLDLNDLTLVLIGLAFKMLRLMVLAFSTETWMVYLSVVVGCPSAMIISGAKSLISKSVDEDEMGKTFSLLSAGETVSNLLGSVFFISVYTGTFRVFAGMTFVIDAAFHGLLFVVLVSFGRRVMARSRLADVQETLGIKETPVLNYGAAETKYVPLLANGRKPSGQPLLEETEETDSEYEYEQDKNDSKRADSAK